MTDDTPSKFPKWNTARIDMLKRLWDDGDSCSEIAVRLNCGFTRNAVIGKAHRLNLPKRVQTYFNRKPSHPKRVKPAPILTRAPSKPSLRPNPIPKLVIAPLTAPASLGVFIEHVKGCKHGVDFRDGKHCFCDSFPLWNNSAYCQFHYQLNHRADGRI